MFYDHIKEAEARARRLDRQQFEVTMGCLFAAVGLALSLLLVL